MTWTSATPTETGWYWLLRYGAYAPVHVQQIGKQTLVRINGFVVENIEIEQWKWQKIPDPC